MLFNSYNFILIFLPITLAVYYTLIKLNKPFIVRCFLVIVSLYFYSYGKIANFYIISFSLVFNYTIYKLIVSKKSRIWLFIGILGNIGLLGYFKYTNFLVENINGFLNLHINISKIALPLGISFFTFQQLGFLIDAYRDKSIKYNFINYCVFITFFPQLVAGPIVSHDELVPQMERKLSFDADNFCRGLFLFSIGLSKKVLLADFFSAKVQLGFDTLDSLTFLQSWVTSISYTLQLFFDFSGYSDMAIGIGLLFNIILPFNFLSPYKASSIREFWARWHITLSRFLTKYIYIPLGGNRKGIARTYLNLFIVFFVSGIWHGAGWTFILWGIMHGIAIIINRVWDDLGLKFNKLLGWFITMNFVNTAWVFFRAASLKDAIKILKPMFRFNTLNQVQNMAVFGGWSYLVILSLIIIAVISFHNTAEFLDNFKFNYMYAIVSGMLLAISILSINKLSEFIYFNF